ncbi:hypothetical protein DL764_006980 [Monosporascus ibericus]|uniref:F-box domain-containing protein n=1 Tax=Monosporascus ibericus TaxID=155417 RepID=A0A4V1X9X5_9PEZI|nr:hypothetical protein DL764_006980 [Monosporascus ibericus]
MLSLPDEVIIAVFQNLAVPDDFPLALAGRRLAVPVMTYSQRIAPFAAQNSFPDAHLLTYASSSVQDFEWLKSLVPRYITTLLVDKFRLRRPHMYSDDYGIPTESRTGRSFEVKLRVLNRLSIVSKEVYRIVEGGMPRVRCANELGPLF